MGDESVKDTSQVLEETTEDSQLDTDSVKTDTEGTEETEGQSIPYDRFKQVNSQKNEFKTKAEELEKKLNSYSWVDDFTKVLENNPEKEQMIIDIIADKKKEIKEAQDDGDVDEVTKLKNEVNQLKGAIDDDKQTRQTRIYKAYTDDFEAQIEGIERTSLLGSILMNATQSVLDSTHKGWRERHNPALVAKAYEKVRDELGTYLNKEKKDYIDNKTKSDSPDIGSGSSGSTVDKIPRGDEGKMSDWVSDFMTGKKS